MKFPPFLQTRSRLKLFMLIFHSSPHLFFFSHTMKPSNVSSRNYYPLVERALSALQKWQAMVSRNHAGSQSTTCGSLQCLHLPSAPFLQVQCGQDKLCVLPPCSFSCCKNPWGFQLRRDQRLKSPCWFTGTCGRHENSLHLYIWTLERLCLPRLGYPPALSWNLLSRGYGRLSSFQEVLEITISCMCLSA